MGARTSFPYGESSGESPAPPRLDPLRLLRFIYQHGRPWRGWPALLTTCALAVLPALALDANRWTRLDRTQTVLALTGVLAVIFTWWIGGWMRPLREERFRPAALLLQAFGLTGLGALVLSLLLARWLPGPTLLWSGLRYGDWSPAAAHPVDALQGFGARLALWWIGVRSGGASQDELVFALFAGALIWLTAVLTSAILRSGRGLAGALPLLLTVGSIVSIGARGRLLFVAALALAIVLHITLDNERLQGRWKRLRLDFSPDIFVERWVNAGALTAAVLLIAAFSPSLTITSLSNAYAKFFAPLDERIESVRRQAFPSLQRSAEYQIVGTVTTGLPNSFLLGAGPELDQTTILLLRTGDSTPWDTPPPSPYLRAVSLVRYDGRGWQPESASGVIAQPANQRRTLGSEETRRLQVQTVQLLVNTSTTFAAAEPVEFSTPVRLRLDPRGELTAAAGAGRSYIVISRVPALDEAALLSLPAWDTLENPLPPGFEAYLELPDTVTERTRALARQITSALESPYARAAAIESFLRDYPYDLSIGEPPQQISDVTDYFLFDLQRGYCDYYATAFVVLARLAGLPARYSAGYAPGDWQENERAWRVSAADSHSWPEVYLPRIGWLAFEPTASRPPLARLGQGASLALTPGPSAPLEAQGAPAFVWNWQMLFWLLPLALLAWGVSRAVERWRSAREDPWQALLRWGTRAGRPPSPGETALEYSAAVAELAASMGTRSPEEARTAAREAGALGNAVSRLLYAPPAERADARSAVVQSWQRLRSLLPRLRR